MLNYQNFHLDIQKHRRNPYGLLRSYFKNPDGSLRRTTIARLNNLSLDQLTMIQAALQDKAVPKSDFIITSSREFGASHACVAIMKTLNLHKTIYSRHSDDWVQACLAIIAGRLVYAGSKLTKRAPTENTHLITLSRS